MTYQTPPLHFTRGDNTILRHSQAPNLEHNLPQLQAPAGSPGVFMFARTSSTTGRTEERVGKNQRNRRLPGWPILAAAVQDCMARPRDVQLQVVVSHGTPCFLSCTEEANVCVYCMSLQVVQPPPRVVKATTISSSARSAAQQLLDNVRFDEGPFPYLQGAFLFFSCT